MLEELARDAVRFRAERYTDPGDGEQDPPVATGAPTEVEARLAAENYERHYRNWLDTPVPVLGGRTPRHAARLKTMRPRIVALLKDFESRAERQRREGRPAYDFGWMWDALGLERP